MRYMKIVKNIYIVRRLKQERNICIYLSSSLEVEVWDHLIDTQKRFGQSFHQWLFLMKKKRKMMKRVRSPCWSFSWWQHMCLIARQRGEVQRKKSLSKKCRSLNCALSLHNVSTFSPFSLQQNSDFLSPQIKTKLYDVYACKSVCVYVEKRKKCLK